jgi:hypothetical protein
MQDFLTRIEEACLQMDPTWLWVPGLIAAALGLFLWLGGTRYAFFVVGFLGAMMGAGIGLLISQWFETPLLLSAGIGAAVLAVIAVLMEHTVIMLLATLIFAATCGTTYLSFSLDDSWKQTLEERARQKILQENNLDATGFLQAPREEESDYDDMTDDSLENDEEKTGLAKLKSVLADLKESLGSNKGMLILWILLGAAAGLTLGYLLKRIMMALCCSIVGSALIIGGILALILAKQTAVISSLQGRPRLLPTIFVGMILLGSLVQLLLAGSKKVVKAESKDKEDE